MRKIECVIMDWAGTSVDYGCFAPVAAFLESFTEIGMPVDEASVRAHMGLSKIEEVRALFRIPAVSQAFRAKCGRDFNEEDVQNRYAAFQKVLFSSLEKYSEPIPGVVETVSALRSQRIKFGSTTGYTAKMMEVVRPAAAANGYVIDNCVTSDCLPAGHPFPYMIYRNMCDLAIPSRFSVLKFGDTIADIREGVNAGVWSVGVILGSNELALTQKEAESLPEPELKRRMLEVRNRMYAAGADYVVDSMQELPALIDSINQRMELQGIR